MIWDDLARRTCETLFIPLPYPVWSKMIKIVLLRHGESTWNKENRFTGWTDVGLSEKGVAEAWGRPVVEGRRLRVRQPSLRAGGPSRPWTSC